MLADNVGNFIGFVDESNVTIQFKLIAPGSVLIDMPDAASSGSFQLQVDSAKAHEVIDSLSTPFSRYKEILGLRFQKWGPDEPGGPSSRACRNRLSSSCVGQ